MNTVMYSSNTCEWETPQDFFDKLNEEFCFTLDPCATHENAKCAKHYTREEDGLSQDWTGETVYCNPPYGRDMPLWIEKCARHAAGGVLLLCYCLRGRTRGRFMRSYTGKRRFDLSKAVSNSAEARTALRFRQWSWCSVGGNSLFPCLCGLTLTF
jgi:site-specific DNA-methyltransferase (adenine-specific)